MLTGKTAEAERNRDRQANPKRERERERDSHREGERQRERERDRGTCGSAIKSEHLASKQANKFNALELLGSK